MNAERNFTPRLGVGWAAGAYQATPNWKPRVLPVSAIDRWDRVMSRSINGYSTRGSSVNVNHCLTFIIKGDWRFYARTSFYRNRDTGEQIRDREWVRIRDDFTDAMYPGCYQTPASRCLNVQSHLHEWLRRMALIVRDTHLALWLWGSGGYNTMDSTSLVVLADTLRSSISIISHRFDRQSWQAIDPKHRAGVFPFRQTETTHFACIRPDQCNAKGL